MIFPANIITKIIHIPVLNPAKRIKKIYMPLKKINNHKKKKQCVFLFLNRTMIRNTLHRFANKNERTDHHDLMHILMHRFIRTGKG